MKKRVWEINVKTFLTLFDSSLREPEAKAEAARLLSHLDDYLRESEGATLAHDGTDHMEAVMLEEEDEEGAA